MTDAANKDAHLQEYLLDYIFSGSHCKQVISISNIPLIIYLILSTDTRTENHLQ